MNEPAKKLVIDRLQLLEASVGGYFGSSYNIRIDFLKQETEYTVYDAQFEGERKRIIKHKTEDLLEFIVNLNELEITKWKPEYNQCLVLDGTSWSVSIQCKDEVSYEFRGSNEYPEEWNPFCEAVSNLIGDVFS